jgi:TolA-binding protein
MALCLFAGGSEDSDYQLAHGYYVAGEYRLAAKEFESFIGKWTASGRADTALLYWGESHFQLREWKAAAQSFERMLKEHPRSARRSEAMLRAMRARWRLDDFTECLAHAENFLRENRPRLGTAQAPPTLADQLADAAYFAGEACFALKRHQEARVHWLALLNDASPNSPLTLDAAEGLGWVAFEEKKFEEAAAYFARTADHPKHEKSLDCRLMEGRAWAELFRKTALPAHLAAALTAFEKIMAADQGAQALKALLQKAEILLDAEKLDETLAAHRLLTRRETKDPLISQRLRRAAEVFFEAGRHGDTVELADACLAFPGDKNDLQVALDKCRSAGIKARSLAALKRAQDAVLAAQAGVGLAENLPVGRTQEEKELRDAALARALFIAGELRGAEGEAYFRRLLKEVPVTAEVPFARLRLALLLAESGKPEEALAEIEPLRRLRETELDPALRADVFFLSGDLHFRREFYDRAEPLLREFLRVAKREDLRRTDAVRELAWCLFKSKKNEAVVEAQELLRGLLSAVETQNIPAALKPELLWLSALCALHEKDLPSALARLGEIAEKHAQSAFADQANYEAARNLYENGRTREALPWLNRLLDDPEAEKSALKTPSLKLRTLTKLAIEDFAGALSDVDLLLKRADLKDDLDAVKLLKALALSALSNRTSDALAALNDLLVETDKTTDALTSAVPREGLKRRGLLLWREGDFSGARRDFARLLGDSATQGALDDEEKRDLALRLACCLAELKETAGAQAILARLVAETLSGAMAFDVPNQQGRVAYLDKDYVAAAEHFRRALKVLDSSAGKVVIPVETVAGAWFNLAWSEKLLKRPAEAARAFGEAARLAPNGDHAAQALLEQGRLLVEAGDLEAALKTWRSLREQKPEAEASRLALLDSAVAQVRAGRFESAAEEFNEYLKKQPDSNEAREAWCGLGECLLRLPKREGVEAEAAFRKAMEAADKTGRLDEVAARALLGLAETALDCGDALTAKKHSLRVVIGLPESEFFDEALFLSALASENLGEPEKAIAYYRDLLKKCPKSARVKEANERLKALGAPVDAR